MISSYILVTSLVMLFFGIFWKTDNNANIIAKMTTFGIGIWGLVLLFTK